jgi:hypothetical protein
VEAELDPLDDRVAKFCVRGGIRTLTTCLDYGRSEQGWAWMKDIISVLDQPHEVVQQGTNGDYPEVSYTLLSQTVEGLIPWSL